MAEIEYFYAAYSGYAYLGSKKFMEIILNLSQPIIMATHQLDLLEGLMK